MKTKIAIIKVTACWMCPNFNNEYDYCRKHGVTMRLHKPDNIARTDNIPNFCELPDDTTLTEAEQQHLEASMKQNKALMQELAGK